MTEVVEAARRADEIGARQITFAPSASLSLGVEIELQLIDTGTLDLTARAAELIAACPDLEGLEPEFFQSTVELKSGICTSVQDAEDDLRPRLQTLARRAASLLIGLCTTGCHPFARYESCHVTDTERYWSLIERHQWLTRRMTVYGLHFHLGMTSGMDCIRMQNSLLPYLPHLLALSASSPFWQGQDTGLASCRPSTYDALPTAGQPYPVHDWSEFEQLVSTLRTCGAIDTTKDLWWDIRPSPHHGTLEIRCCDGPATIEEALAIMAFVHLLAISTRERISGLPSVSPPPRWMLRENKWRAIRHGLNANVVIVEQGQTMPIRAHLLLLIESMSDLARTLSYQPYLEVLHDVIRRGNSSMRQRAVFARRRSTDDVVCFNVREFCEGRPIWH